MARKKYDDEMAHILYSAMKDSKEAKKASKSLKSVGTAIGKKIKSFVRKAPLFAALGVYYAFTGPTDTQVENKKDYYLPDQITVTDTNLPHKTVGLEKIINIKD
ncbi:MAG TPA: hypothetical protein VEC16_01200, partial [Alphaproteobacteria bacterium]|nr:hypothetical protein [Alphaproteobacteria bacterium]